MDRLLVVNADDFGLSRGINRGIIEAHLGGIVTSASLMVNAPRCQEAMAMSQDCPNLSLGLHFTVTDEQGPLYDLDDVELIRSLLAAQFQKFLDVVGTPPTHLDSHHHVHRRKSIKHLFIELAERYGIPLRGSRPVKYWGFYAQWKYGHTEPKYVSVDFLRQMLAELTPGAHEFGCHPGYVSDDFQSIYNAERELELTTLTDLRAQQGIEEYSIVLLNYRELKQRLSSTEHVERFVRG